MKLFSLTIWYLIFGYIISIEYNYRIYDIIYSAEYIVDVEKEPLSPQNYLFFRLKVDSNEKLGVTVKIVEQYFMLFNVHIIGFSEYPNEKDIINAQYKYKNLHLDSEKWEGKLNKIVFPIEEFTDAKYLVIYIRLHTNLQYLSILVSPYKKKEPLFYKEITYNQELILDSETLNNYESAFLLWFKNENLEDGIVKIKLHKDDINDLLIFLVGTEDRPQLPFNNSNIIENSFFFSSSNTTDSNYITYKYHYLKFHEKSKYIVLNAASFMSNFKYFSVYVGKESNSNLKELQNSYKISCLNVYSLFALLLLLLF